ncbi:hypothetical protein FA13DRAFT_299778 [Coprinellus micaceus]|uniref:Uncharacterized protein n=1 Tax=Coprinellus micaceus TaxID=71717 RepID=A0A4Y7SEN7_COPMI|nr:hypothetical protein FA13DRAFT_299778 [Coprinellus micaceus]
MRMATEMDVVRFGCDKIPAIAILTCDSKGTFASPTLGFLPPPSGFRPVPFPSLRCLEVQQGPPSCILGPTAPSVPACLVLVLRLPPRSRSAHVLIFQPSTIPPLAHRSHTTLLPQHPLIHLPGRYRRALTLTTPASAPRARVRGHPPPEALHEKQKATSKTNHQWQNECDGLHWSLPNGTMKSTGLAHPLILRAAWQIRRSIRGRREDRAQAHRPCSSEEKTDADINDTPPGRCSPCPPCPV